MITLKPGAAADICSLKTVFRRDALVDNASRSRASGPWYAGSYRAIAEYEFADPGPAKCHRDYVFEGDSEAKVRSAVRGKFSASSEFKVVWPVDLSVKTDKAVYKSGEKVTVDLIMANNSPKPVAVAKARYKGGVSAGTGVHVSAIGKSVELPEKRPSTPQGKMRSTRGLHQIALYTSSPVRVSGSTASRLTNFRRREAT
ncbi:MAG: hypothetical protein ACR2HJ_02795 [Fimbriimonadales bacterium]